MADLKISQLTGATTPLAGTEEVPIVQSGVTKKVSVANLTTLSTGTVNGVAYLNASKVLTTGSALTFDGGNLGLGVTLSNWEVTRKAIQIPDSGYFASSGPTMFFAANIYVDSSFTSRYIVTGAASRYRQINGAHQWAVAPSGTAGDAVTFSQSMTFETSGNLTLNTGNLVPGTAAKGVNFTANTPAAGMTSQLLNWYEEITAASTACTGAITTAASWTLTRVGNVITLTLPPITGAATSSAYFEFGVVVPSGYRPASSLVFPCGVRDNDANQSTVGMCIVTSSGNIRIYPNIAASANFTANVSATAAGFAQGCGFSCSWRL